MSQENVKLVRLIYAKGRRAQCSRDFHPRGTP
jgi:hypothetical protein